MTVLQDILTYPFRGGGKYVLFLVAFLSAVADVASLAPVFGGIAWFLLLGYFCATYFKVIETSATGSMEAPDFPEVSSIFEDVVKSMFKVIAISAVCFGPATIYGIFAESRAIPAVTHTLTICGYVYFPMAMLAVTCLGYLGAMSPHIVLPAILRAGGFYWMAVFLLLILEMLLGFLAERMSSSPLIGVVVLATVGAWVFLTNGRILGLIYRERREEMRWN